MQISKFQRNDDVSYTHPIKRVPVSGRVLEVDQVGDPSDWRILVGIGDTRPTWQRNADCTLTSTTKKE